jgi:hypothetical protein
MTYDVVLWKAKAKAKDAPGLIALTLSDNRECTSVARIPKTRVAAQLEAAFSCPLHALPFEVDLDSQKVLVGFPHGDSLAAGLATLQGVAIELGLSLFDFQRTPPTEEDGAEHARRLNSQQSSEEHETFRYALEAAQKGSAKDMHFVGSCYRTGTGVAKDPEQAIDWYERAVAGGMRSAYGSIADVCREDLGTPDALARGYALLKEGANAGSLLALGMLADWTAQGVGTGADAVAAFKLWSQLLESDESVAAFEIAKAYELGEGVAPSKETAIVFFRRARKAGHPDALRQLRRLGAEPDISTK